MESLEVLAKFADAGVAVFTFAVVLFFAYRYHMRVRGDWREETLADKENLALLQKKFQADLEELQTKHRAEREDWRKERAQIAQDRMAERRECDERYERTLNWQLQFLDSVESVKKKEGS